MEYIVGFCLSAVAGWFGVEILTYALDEYRLRNEK